jgi:predicted membrane protein
MNYKIELQEQTKKKHQTTSLHLITGFALLGIGAFTFLMSNTDWIKSVFHASIIPSIVVGSLSFCYGLLVLYLVFLKGKWLKIAANNKTIRLTHIAISAALLIVFLLSQWWLAAGIMAVITLANAYAIFYEQKMNETLFVLLDEDGITLPTISRRKHLKWTETERVILRHGNITIDTTDNFLYQWAIAKSNIDSQECEDFSAAKIMANLSKRESNDW